jgi:cell shape-determining protein MreC
MNKTTQQDQNITLALGITLIGVLLMIISASGVFNNLYGIGLDLRIKAAAPLTKLSTYLNNATFVLGNIQNVKTENVILKQKNLELKATLEESIQLKEENSYLRRQLNLTPNLELKRLGLGRVVRYEFSPQPGTVYVEISSVQAIKSGDWLITDGFIVGRVQEVYGNYIKAQLINNSIFETSVEVGSGRELAKLKGSDGIEVQLEGVDSSSKIIAGDKIRLLNPGNLALGNYLFGYVDQLIKNDINSTLEIKVVTPVDLTNLTFVLITLNKK